MKFWSLKHHHLHQMMQTNNKTKFVNTCTVSRRNYVFFSIANQTNKQKSYYWLRWCVYETNDQFHSILFNYDLLCVSFNVPIDENRFEQIKFSVVLFFLILVFISHNKYKLILCKCISSYFPFVCPMMICVCVFIYHFFSLHSMIWNEKKIEIKSNQICNISYFMVIKSFVFLF